MYRLIGEFTGIEHGWVAWVAAEGCWDLNGMGHGIEVYYTHKEQHVGESFLVLEEHGHELRIR